MVRAHVARGATRARTGRRDDAPQLFLPERLGYPSESRISTAETLHERILALERQHSVILLQNPGTSLVTDGARDQVPFCSQYATLERAVAARHA
jgi:hypothetical protein